MANLFNGTDIGNEIFLNGMNLGDGGNRRESTSADTQPHDKLSVGFNLDVNPEGYGTVLTLQNALQIDIRPDGEISFGLLGNSAGETGGFRSHGLNLVEGGSHAVRVDYDSARGSMIGYVDGQQVGSMHVSAPLNAIPAAEVGASHANLNGAVDGLTVTADAMAPPAAPPDPPRPVPEQAPPAHPDVPAEAPAQPHGAGEGIVVANSAALNAALAHASGGETFLLRGDGNYAINVSNWSAHGEAVTVTSADANRPAHVTGIDVSNAHGLVIDHVRVQSPATVAEDPDIRIVDSSDITIRNSQMLGEASGFANSRWADDMLEAYNVHGLTFANNEVSNYFFGLNIHRSADIVVEGNDLHTIQGDGMRFSADKGVTIENNWFHDFLGADGNLNHNDYIQFWTAGTNTPSTNIVIRGNLLANTSGTESQAIFMADEANNGTRFQNVLIERNFIENHHIHGITVNRADGVVVRDNTMPVLPGGQWNMLSKININDSTAARIYDNLTNGVEPLRTAVARNDGNAGPANLTAVIAGEETGARSFAFDGRYSVNKSGFVGNHAEFQWDFGDGTKASGARVTKTYNDAGDHQVVLTVLHDDGNSDTATLVAGHHAPTIQAPDDTGSLSFLHHGDLWS